MKSFNPGTSSRGDGSTPHVRLSRNLSVGRRPGRLRRCSARLTYASPTDFPVCVCTSSASLPTCSRSRRSAGVTGSNARWPGDPQPWAPRSPSGRSLGTYRHGEAMQTTHIMASNTSRRSCIRCRASSILSVRYRATKSKSSRDVAQLRLSCYPSCTAGSSQRFRRRLSTGEQRDSICRRRVVGRNAIRCRHYPETGRPQDCYAAFVCLDVAQCGRLQSRPKPFPPTRFPGSRPGTARHGPC